jgi:hypothetical protein
VTAPVRDDRPRQQPRRASADQAPGPARQTFISFFSSVSFGRRRASAAAAPLPFVSVLVVCAGGVVCVLITVFVCVGAVTVFVCVCAGVVTVCIGAVAVFVCVTVVGPVAFSAVASAADFALALLEPHAPSMIEITQRIAKHTAPGPLMTSPPRRR